MSYRFRFADSIIFFIFIVLSLFSFRGGLHSLGSQKHAVIRHHGEVHVYALPHRGSLVLNGPNGEENTISFEDDSVRISHANCSNQVCVAQGSIEHSGEWIACLPNKVFVSIEGRPLDNTADAISY